MQKYIHTDHDWLLHRCGVCLRSTELSELRLTSSLANGRVLWIKLICSYCLHPYF